MPKRTEINAKEAPKQSAQLDDLPLSSLPNVLNPEHIQRYLGIGRRQVYELMHSEGFPAFKVGRSIKVEKQRFIDWLDKKAKEPLKEW